MQFKLLALAGLASVATAQTGQSLVQALNSTAELSNLTAILGQQPQLVSALGGLSNITILAPNNAALTAFLANNATQAAVAANPGIVSAILQYHVLNGTYQNFSTNTSFIRTLLNNATYANVTGGQRVQVTNTTVYSGLASNSSVLTQTVNFTGGVIHIIDRVLTLPPALPAALTAYNLTSAYGALNATQQFGAVGGLRDVTIFVPNNAAFRAIGSAVSNLTTQQLAGILAYHVVNGTVAYSNTLMNMSVPTLAGTNLTISVRNATNVYVNNARVVIPNVLVANGVVHVIDQVLNPMNATVTNGTSGTPAFNASSGADEPFTSGQPRPTSSINTGSIIATATGGAGASSSSSGGAWMPKATGAMGAALGGLALIMQL